MAGAHVIPRPGDGLLDTVVFPLAGRASRAAPDAPPPAGGADEDFEAMTVRELRALARDRDGGLSGRDIARATKAELVASSAKGKDTSTGRGQHSGKGVTSPLGLNAARDAVVQRVARVKSW